MVNEKQGKVYEPVPIYNRKMLRRRLRYEIESEHGAHKTSRKMAFYFKQIRNNRKEGNNNEQ